MFRGEFIVTLYNSLCVLNAKQRQIDRIEQKGRTSRIALEDICQVANYSNTKDRQLFIRR